MSKNIFSDNRLETTIVAEKTSFKRNSVDVWPDYGYFKHQPCDFGIDKENFPKNSIFSIRGISRLRITKKFIMSINFLIGQVNV